MTEFIWFVTGTFIGAWFAILILAICKMSGRCSPAEQVEMDNEQVREVRSNAKWKARIDAQRDRAK